LSQLHPFYLNIIKVVESSEKLDVTTALAHVIKHVPVESLDHVTHPPFLKVLEMFCLPVAERLHAIASAGKPAAGASLEKGLRDELKGAV
jgi:hypothetical protein